jgi:hypothetical protein
MVKTQSEEFFEQYCTGKGITWKKIQEAVSRTPDYELTACGQGIIVEVKEITANDEEKESERLRRERGWSVSSSTPGDRVRKKITNSSAQIKARTQGLHPSILVSFDYGRVHGHLDPYQIRVAMYGLEQVHIAVPPIGSGQPLDVTRMSYGPKRKMTEEHNTSVSAIGVLFLRGPDDVRLTVYHNKFASLPLDPALLASYGVEQFELDNDAAPGTTAQWREIVRDDRSDNR